MSDDPIKDALRMMPYGFYAISSGNGEDSNVMVANWVTQVSFSPRQVAVAVQITAYSHDLIANGGSFVINIFGKEEADAIKPFTKGREKNPDKMKEAKFTPAQETGGAVLEGAAAYLECKLVGKHNSGGDHDIFVGEVVGAKVIEPGEAGETLSLPHIGWSYAG